MQSRFTAIAAETRRTVTVVDDTGAATVCNEPGAKVLLDAVGDALTAAPELSVVRGHGWETTLASGVALSAAVVSVATAGETDPALDDRLLSAMTVEELEWAW